MKWFSFTKEKEIAYHDGNIPFEYGDYLIIPRGYLSNWFWNISKQIVLCRIFAPFYTPKRYKNESGQHLGTLHFVNAILFYQWTRMMSWRFLIKLKGRHDTKWFTLHILWCSGLGWLYYPMDSAFITLNPLQDGYINRLQHQTFETSTFVVCSFVPRLYDYHQNLFQLHTIAIMIGDEVLLLYRWWFLWSQQ
jgi:homogentisate 1,2-dioxygenase